MKNIIIYGSDGSFVKMLKLECKELLEHLGDFNIYTVNAQKENALQVLYELIFTKLQDCERFFIGESDAIERRDERNLQKLLGNLERNDIDFILYGRGASPVSAAQYVHMHDFFRTPFSVDEFLSTLYSALFPKKGAECTTDGEETITRLLIDDKLFTVTANGKKCGLSPREFELFAVLYENRGKVLTRNELIGTVWKCGSGTNICDVYINYLRNKLKKSGIPIVIKTVRGIGYIME